MPRRDFRFITAIHRFLFRASGGRIGGELDGKPIVMIETIGRRSGKVRLIPVNCYPYEESVCVLASNNGSDRAPSWWLNLEANPDTWASLGRERFPIHAEVLDSEARTSVWPELVELNPRVAEFEEMTEREIPVVVLRRTSRADT